MNLHQYLCPHLWQGVNEADKVRWTCSECQKTEVREKDNPPVSKIVVPDDVRCGPSYR